MLKLRTVLCKSSGVSHLLSQAAVLSTVEEELEHGSWKEHKAGVYYCVKGEECLVRKVTQLEGQGKEEGGHWMIRSYIQKRPKRWHLNL